MDSDGSNRRQLTHFPPGEGQAQVPDWSPDGRQLTVQTSGRTHVGHVWIVDAGTGAARKLGAHNEPYVDEVPRWFPDGKRIAFQSDRTGRMEVWVMNSDGSGQRPLTR
jgi:TolB protein